MAKDCSPGGDRARRTAAGGIGQRGKNQQIRGLIQEHRFSSVKRSHAVSAAGIALLETEKELDLTIEKLKSSSEDPLGGYEPFLDGLPRLGVLKEYGKLQAELKNKAPDLLGF